MEDGRIAFGAGEVGWGWVDAGGVLTISELVQMLAQQHRTGELEVSNGQCVGRLYFRCGELVDATCDTAGFRGMQGVACLIAMPGKPVSRFRPTEPVGPRTIGIPTVKVLLTAAELAANDDRTCPFGLDLNPAVPPKPGSSAERFLRVIIGDREEFRPLPTGTLRVGRDMASDIIIFHYSVSRNHAVMQRVGPIFVVRDLDSRNGTFVNGRRIGQSQVDRGDEIRFGLVQAFLVGDDGGEPYRKTEPVAQPREGPHHFKETTRIRPPETGSSTSGKQ